MSKFKLIADIDKLSKQPLVESVDSIESVDNLTEMKTYINENGIVTESVAEFIKSTEEFLKHGSFPLWNRLTDKEDENGDGKIDDADKIGYVAKVIAGLYFYMKKDLRNSDEEAFAMVVKNLTKHDIDKNVKAQVEKNAQLSKFVDNVMANYSKPATKTQLSGYLTKIQDYYLSDLPAEITEGKEWNTGSDLYDYPEKQYKAWEKLQEVIPEDILADLCSDGGQNIGSILDQYDLYPYDRSELIAFIKAIRKNGI